ncbi:hypothetical protein [Noviherbaspirillum malthae]|jgi:hypothetical protein|uniref:hypothetical protein n=1 Tax=Noviherbaspirillum malthae TaxID=1260987 RepID=UPI00188FC4F7|nr:hypothetical protein [Noviherbaspirillum malthae]
MDREQNCQTVTVGNVLRTFERRRELTPQEELDRMRQLTDQMRQNPDDARQFLRSAGILDENNNLALDLRN